MTTASIRLAGWKVEGLRCPDHEVSFEKTTGSTHPISLLQMPNGTGKTTTLKLLRAALSGQGPEGNWDPDAIRDMRKNDDAKRGMFQLALLHNQQRVTLTLRFDFEEPAVSYSTTTHVGNREGFHPPRELLRFLNPTFVNFFIFDGELADSLLDRQKTNAQQVIEDLFQLKLFDRMESWIDQYWKDESTSKTKEGGSNSQTAKGLNKWKGWMERYEARKAELIAQQKDLLDERERVKTRQIKLRNESNAAIQAKKEYQGRLSTAERSLEQAEGRIEAHVKAALNSFRAPQMLSAVFGKEMLSLKDSLDHAKLPDSAAREFFEDLSKDPVCVCGRQLDDTSRQAIRERAKLYLGSEDVGLLNQIKGEISSQVGTDPAEHESALQTQLTKLQESIKNAANLRAARDAIKAEAVHEDPELEKKEKEILTLQSELATLDHKLSRFDDSGGPDNDKIEQTWGIAVIEKGLERAKRMYAEIADTLQVKARAEALQQIIQLARIESRSRISVAICDDANARTRELMPHNAIRIERIDRCLRLAGGKSGGSAGETLAVAYAFLSTLFRRGDYQLPFVVDSPAGPLDHPKRAAVAALIPKLAGQFVAFVISTERDGFQDKLDDAARGEIQYLTLFRKGDATMEKAASREQDVRATTDGVLVTGKPFFEAFQIDKENGDAV